MATGAAVLAAVLFAGLRFRTVVARAVDMAFSMTIRPFSALSLITLSCCTGKGVRVFCLAGFARCLFAVGIPCPLGFPGLVDHIRCPLHRAAKPADFRLATAPLAVVLAAKTRMAVGGSATGILSLSLPRGIFITG